MSLIFFTLLVRYKSIIVFSVFWLMSFKISIEMGENMIYDMKYIWLINSLAYYIYSSLIKAKQASN